MIRRFVTRPAPEPAPTQQPSEKAVQWARDVGERARCEVHGVLLNHRGDCPLADAECGRKQAR